jgi:hypothetical protein
VFSPGRGIGGTWQATNEGRHDKRFDEMRIQVETFAKDSDAPAQISPELVLVSPPEEARAAREALPEPGSPATVPVSRPALRAEPLGQVPPEARVMAAPLPGPPPASVPMPPPAAPPAPAAPLPRRRSRWLLLVPALVLGASGFVAGRELGDRHGSGGAAAEPATAQLIPQRRSTTASAQRPETSTGRTSSARTTTSSTAATKAPSQRPEAKPAPKPAPVVSWKARPGVGHYRLDLLRGGVVILTILTDQPSTKIPLTWPNAGRRRRLTPGTYRWTVRAATARTSRLLAHGTITVR